jgi:RND superfamily putative drug exporter
VIATWAVITAVAFPRALRVSDVLRVEGRTVTRTESGRANELLRGAFSRPVAEYFAVAVTAAIPVDSTPYRVFLDSLAARAAREPYISRVVSAREIHDSSLVSRDRHTAFLIAAVAVGQSNNASNLVPRFRAAVHEVARSAPPGGGFRIAVTGGPALDYDLRVQSRMDTDRAEARGLPLSGLFLILAFGGLLAALLPLLVAAVSVLCGLGLIHLIGSHYSLSFFVLSVVSMLGLALGIDYSLLIITRFREELGRGHDRPAAIRRTMQTAGRAVLVSGSTVLLGFGALLVTPLSDTRSIGMGGMVIVATVLGLALTLLPALLSLLGDVVDRPRWLSRRLRWYQSSARWDRWARWLGVHPVRALVLGSTIIVAVSLPVLGIRIGLPHEGWFPSRLESGVGITMARQAGLGGLVQPVRVVLQAPAGQRIVASRHLTGLRHLSDTIRSDPRVAGLRGIVDFEPGMSLLRLSVLFSDMAKARARSPDFFSAYLSEDNRTTLVDIFLADTTSYTGGMEFVRELRETVRGGITGLDSVRVLVGGFDAASLDAQNETLHAFPFMVLLVLGTTSLVLLVAFRSILVPLKAVLMNALSVAGAFGLMVLVFQHGVGVRLFGLAQPTEAIWVVVPVIVFAVVFGLSMDYEVFLVSRMREVFEQTGDNTRATLEGLRATATMITSAAVIMVIVFGTFSFGRILPVQLVGFGLAVAVLLDATVIRMLLVPSIMRVAGRWNWWPGVSGRGVHRTASVPTRSSSPPRAALPAGKGRPVPRKTTAP